MLLLLQVSVSDRMPWGLTNPNEDGRMRKGSSKHSSSQVPTHNHPLSLSGQSRFSRTPLLFVAKASTGFHGFGGLNPHPSECRSPGPGRGVCSASVVKL